MAAGQIAEGRYSVLAAGSATSCICIQSSYVQKRATQTNFIYCPAVSHRHLTLLSGRAHRSVGLDQEPAPRTPKPFSSTRRHPNSRGCCHQPPCRYSVWAFYRHVFSESFGDVLVSWPEKSRAKRCRSDDISHISAVRYTNIKFPRSFMKVS